MNENLKPSPLVYAVTALDNHFAELERLGAKIAEMELRSDFDFEQMQKLMLRFSESGEGVAVQVSALSNELNQARVRADAVAKIVAEKAQLLNERREERAQKMETFRRLGEKVRELSTGLGTFERPGEGGLSESERADLKNRLATFQAQLRPLIDEALDLRKDAQTMRMKTLEQNAESLSQTLVMIQKKVQAMELPPAHPELLN